MFTRTRRPTAPALVYRNPSATLSVWADGDVWRLVVGDQDGAEVTFPFANRLAAESAAGWLAYRDLSGKVRPDLTWHGLVDSVLDGDPAAAATAAVSGTLERRMPAWVDERRGDPVAERRRALEDRVTDTPSARVAAKRRAAREFHEHIATSAVEEWRSKAPLEERLREDDGPAVAELFLRCLMADAQVREDTLAVLAELEALDARPLEDR